MLLLGSGGTLVTVHGQFLDSVARPQIAVNFNGRILADVNTMLCNDNCVIC